MEISVDRVKLGRYCVEWHYGIASRDEFCPSFLLNFVIANESKASPKQSHSAVQHNTDPVSRWSSKWPILTVFFLFLLKIDQSSEKNRRKLRRSCNDRAVIFTVKIYVRKYLLLRGTITKLVKYICWHFVYAWIFYI